MEVRIDAFHILESHLFPENHLIKCANEESIQETPVEDRQSNHSPNECEVVEVLRVDTGVGINLEGVVIMS